MGLKVCPNAQEIEHAGEHVATLGHPGHRLDVLGVNGPSKGGHSRSKQNTHRRIRPSFSYRGTFAPPCRENRRTHKTQGRGPHGVQEDVRQVIPARIQTPHTIVHRQREPTEGLIRTHVRRGEHPPQIRGPQTAKVGVLKDVLVVIPVNEPSVKTGKKGDENQQGNRTRHRKQATVYPP
jgi:hypothetical protein